MKRSASRDSSQPRPSAGLSRRDVDAVYPSLRRAHDVLSAGHRAGGTKDSVLRGALTAGEVGASALGFGYLYGRTQHWNIPGTAIPMGLAAGIAGHLANLFLLGPNSKIAPHLANVSNGAIASWGAMVGAGYGTDARSKAGLPVAAITAGSPAAFGCAPCDRAAAAQLPPPAVVSMAGLGGGVRPMSVTEAELAALSRQVR